LNASDVLGTAAFIARNAPGFGNPLDMPMDVLSKVAETVSDMMIGESGGDTGRAAVDREMRRLLG
jgi:hypothetical protein